MDPDTLVQGLLQLGLAVRRRVLDAVRAGADDLARPIAQVGGDMIYGIDRRVEDVLEETIAAWPADWKPLLLIAEGINEAGKLRFGAETGPLRYRLLVDPIDGTRGLMYDKRSAWFAAAIVPDAGPGTNLADSLAAVLVELPTSKQAWADAFAAVRDRPAWGQRARIDGSEIHDLVVRPSRASSLLDGFGQIVNFFPGTKVLASELMERIVLATLGPPQPERAQVFDDQYISTSGQLVELMVGHDRFCADLRPLFHRIQRGQNAELVPVLACHTYDIAGWLVAQQAGVVLTDGWGGPLQLPLDVHHDVHWCGYANAQLQSAIAPVIVAWLRERGMAES
jgi:hypothetical protein